MQLANVTVRLGGSQLHTVPKVDVTPAEILVLQHIHGADAVVDVRPTRKDKTRGHTAEFERLAGLYDNAASASAPGDEQKSILRSLFPGAMKKLPITLKEVGMGGYAAPEPAVTGVFDPPGGDDTDDTSDDDDDDAKENT